jgi:hypothetical protein
VVKSKDGRFCFISTRGVNPYNIAGTKIRKKSDAEKETP